MTVNYGSGGSGKGRTDLASGVVNYAGSDSPIPASDQSNFKGTVLYFPVVIAPITISYHLSGVSNLKLDAPTIAKIFEAQITTWNNSAITALNPGVNLPSTKITVARRSDSSGTTQNFSEFLVKGAPGRVDARAHRPPSTGRPPPLGGNGNGGVASIIKSTNGAVGYVDYPDAKASGLSYASVKNSAGNFIAPSVQSATTAASNATIMPNLTFSAIWAPGAQSYPITYQSWVLVYQSQSGNMGQLLQAWVGYLVGRRSAAACSAQLRAASLQPAVDGASPGPEDRLRGVTTTAREEAPTRTSSPPAARLSERRPLGDRAFQILALASGLLVLVILVLIAISTTKQSTDWFTTVGFKGVFSKTWNPASGQVRRPLLHLRHPRHGRDRGRDRRPAEHRHRLAPHRGRLAPVGAADRVR